MSGSVELVGREKVTRGITDVIDKKSRQRMDPDYSPDWTDVASFDHLAYGQG